MARPRFVPTEQQRRTVKRLAGLGVQQEEIAAILEISPHTLRRCFRRELDYSIAESKAKVERTLFQMATSGKCVAATIFWAKTHCRMREVRQDLGLSLIGCS